MFKHAVQYRICTHSYKKAARTRLSIHEINTKSSMEAGRRFWLAQVREACLNSVVRLDMFKQQGLIQVDEVYQHALARIRDYGIINGLTAREINGTILYAHGVASDTHARTHAHTHARTHTRTRARTHSASL